MSYELNDITFKELYEENFRNLVYFARKNGMTESAMAEDMITDKFVKLWEQRAGFNDIKSARGFLYLSARNAIKNYFRYKHRTILLTEAWDVEDEITANEIEVSVLEKICEEIEKLSPVCKQVFKMKVFEMLDTSTIANKLKVTYKTADNHYQRARTLLRKRIKYGF